MRSARINFETSLSIFPYFSHVFESGVLRLLPVRFRIFLVLAIFLILARRLNNPVAGGVS